MTKALQHVFFLKQWDSYAEAPYCSLLGVVLRRAFLLIPFCPSCIATQADFAKSLQHLDQGHARRSPKGGHTKHKAW